MNFTKYCYNIFIVCLSFFITSCSGLWTTRINDSVEPNTFINLAKTKNKWYDNGKCGVLAVNQIIHYYRCADTTNYVIKSNGLNFSRFNDSVSLLRYARTNGVNCKLEKISLPIIISDINNSNPVIAFVPSGSSWLSNIVSDYIDHCIVVCGYDNVKRELYFYSDADGPYKISYDSFVLNWCKTGCYAMRCNISNK